MTSTASDAGIDVRARETSRRYFESPELPRRTKGLLDLLLVGFETRNARLAVI